MRKIIGIAHPRLQHFIKIIYGLRGFDKIKVKELSDWLESLRFDEDLRTEDSELKPCAAIEGASFQVCIFNNLFNCNIVRENSRSSSNGMDTGIPDSLVGGLVILNVRKVIVVKNGVNSGLIQLVGFSNPTTGIREDTEIQVFGQHVFLEVFAPGNLRCFGGRHVLLDA